MSLADQGGPPKLGKCIGTAMRDGGVGGGASRVTSVRGGPQGGLFGFKFSSRPHPRKFGLKRFLAVRRSWCGSRVAYFWVTSFRKKFIGGELTFLLVAQRAPRRGAAFYCDAPH